MSHETARPGLPQAHVELRRARLRDAIGRPLEPIGHDAPPLSPERLEFLRREAEDLFWNELSWEQLTEEETVAGGRLTELAFPAFLAFVDGLLPRGRRHHGAGGPHPDAVEQILVFLAERYVEFGLELEQGADSQHLVWARQMTSRLIDLVLVRLYGLSSAELETLDDLD